MKEGLQERAREGDHKVPYHNLQEEEQRIFQLKYILPTAVQKWYGGRDKYITQKNESWGNPDCECVSANTKQTHRQTHRQSRMGENTLSNSSTDIASHRQCVYADEKMFYQDL